jgi:hypothetical protein
MYKSVEEIEFENNLDFKDEFINKYHNIIIDIFNKNHQKYINNDIDHSGHINIILALYYLSIYDYNKAHDILLMLHNIDNLDATCTLGIFYHTYKNDKKTAMEYFKNSADKGHLLSSLNLAFEYLCDGEFELFLKYNDIINNINDGFALINHAIYLWNIKKDYINSEKYFKIAFNNYYNYRAYFEYSKLVSNIELKRELLIKAIKRKPKKIYIDMLKKITNDFERLELYKNNDVNSKSVYKYEKFQFNIINNISRYSRCPCCINNINNYKIELITLKCNHSFCSNCIKKYCKKKCCIC